MKQQIITLLFFLIFIGLSSCNKLEIEKGTPKCIENLISDFDKEQTCENGVNVKKYTFQGEIIYVFEPGFCGADMISNVFDMECNNIGFLGGIVGSNTVNGEDFSSAIFESITWER